MQSFAFNIRRDKFGDPRVRRAFNFVFDFEEMNSQLFSGQYKRIASYFEGTELASSGFPRARSGDTRERAQKGAGRPLHQAVHEPGRLAISRRIATICAKRSHCSAAGYEIRDTKLVDAKTGEQFVVEFLVDDGAAQRFVLFYKPSLERTGMKVDVRVVDAAQYENRLRQWDFDIVVGSWAQSLSPGNEQRGFWSSQAAGPAGLAQPGRHQEPGDR